MALCDFQIEFVASRERATSRLVGLLNERLRGRGEISEERLSIGRQGI